MSRVVLVTGSSKNLGASIVEEFAKCGDYVVINYKTGEENALKLKKKLEEKYNSKVLMLKCDITQEQDVKKMVDIIIEKFGKIDVLVNNAAFEISSDLEFKDYNSFKQVLDVNVIGTFLVTKYVGCFMLKNKAGKIINIASNNGIDKYDPSTMEYDASKAAIINMTYNFAKEFAPYVNVNAVAPGWIKTDDIIQLDNSLDNKFIDSEKDKILLNRFAEPSDISKVIVFLASEDANYINGTVLRVDGGF